MRKFIKRYIRYEKMRLFYPVRTDAEIQNNYENNKYSVPVMALICIIFFFVTDNVNNIIAGIAIASFSIAFVFGIAAKKYIKQIRKYVDFVDLITFVFSEYFLLKFFGCRLTEKWIELLCISTGVWLIALLLKLPYIIRAHILEEKESAKQAHNCKKAISVAVIALLAVCISVFATLRYGGIDSVKMSVVICSIHLSLTMFYNLEINRIFFTAIYREEIAAELEQQRKELEEKRTTEER